MAFTPDEDDYKHSIDHLQDLEFNMEAAIGHVFNNEYILIVGSEVILKPNVEPSGDVNDYLLRHVNFDTYDAIVLGSVVCHSIGGSARLSSFGSASKFIS